MKYTIMGFNQQKLLEFGMDLHDTLLLRYFVDFKGTNGMVSEIHEGKEYYWIKYDYIKDYIPIISIQHNTVLRRRFKKMVDCGILSHYHKKVGGSFSFYALGEKYIELIMDIPTEKLDHATQKCEPCNSKVVGGATEKCEQKINLINNNSYKDANPSSNEDITHIVEYLNLKANKKYTTNKKQTITLINARLKEGYTIQDFETVIDTKVNDWLNNPEFSKYLRPITLFGNKFENYLNESNTYKQEEKEQSNVPFELSESDRLMMEQLNNPK